MNRLLIAAGLALAVTAAHAQETPAPPAPPTSQQEGPAPSAPPTSPQEAEAAAATTGHSTTVYHGPHKYPMKEKGQRAGDPPIIDHSADTLVVEPTHSTITVSVASPP
jgi:hypothetical protein